MKNFGEKVSFSGAEKPVKVLVSMTWDPGTTGHGEKVLTINQDGQSIQLSPQTMRDILIWFGAEDSIQPSALKYSVVSPLGALGSSSKTPARRTTRNFHKVFSTPRKDSRREPE
jgi:hypothetical protein